MLLPGWPRDLSNWSGDPDLAKLQSAGAAITIDQSGNIGVGGNLIVNGKTQPYVALLTPDGARLWQNEGTVGEQLAGLAAFTDQFSNRLVGVGWRRVARTDCGRASADHWPLPFRTRALMVVSAVMDTAPGTQTNAPGARPPPGSRGSLPSSV